MSSVTREQVEQRIRGWGVPIGNVFIIAKENEEEGLIAFWHPQIGARTVIIEKEDMGRACYDYLRGIGVRRFASFLELLEAASLEKWPGWDTCEPSTKQ
jgi:hypothetical protein